MGNALVFEEQDNGVSMRARHSPCAPGVQGNAADADTDDRGRHYFRVVVETGDSTLGDDGNLPIIPGMIATVDIHTGEKRVIDYLIQPVLKIRSEAFRGR